MKLYKKKFCFKKISCKILNYAIKQLIIIQLLMSTLAAARADNFYYSKNYNPEKVPPKKS